MQLIVFTGLPGTGKSTLAEAVGQQLGMPVFSKDRIEATLRLCGIMQAPPGLPSLSYVTYELLTTLVERQLALRQSCILDSVVGVEERREKWRVLAREYGATWRVIECSCSNEHVHRQRLTTRQRRIPGAQELTWEELLQTKARYDPWHDHRLILDAVNDVSDNVAAVVAYVLGSA